MQRTTDLDWEAESVGRFGRRLGGAGGGAIALDEMGIPSKIAFEAVLDVGGEAELVVFVGVDD